MKDRLVVWQDSMAMEGCIEILALNQGQVHSVMDFCFGKRITEICFNRASSSVFVGLSNSGIHLISDLSWTEVFRLDHSMEKLTSANTSELINIYREAHSGDGIYYEALQRPYTIPATQSATDKVLCSID